MGGRGPADGIGGNGGGCGPMGDDAIDDVTDTGIEELTEGADDEGVEELVGGGGP